MPVVAHSAAPGKELYETRCATCHGEKAQGSSIAPSLIGKSAADIHLMLDTGRMPASLPYLNEIHQQPRFTYAQMSVLVRYIQTFTPHPDTSLPLLMPGNPVRGRTLFAENCAVCHGAAADGASVGADNVAPSLRNATVFQVGEAIHAGPEIMPRFGPDVLSAQDVDDIAWYINALQTDSIPPAEDPGGLSLAHVGPVAEGFVAWFFGIGLLVVVVRFIAATKQADR
ncbi:MAG: c-type cytochrome [Candidatus Eremiobacteraeota bacterium]|nr:c-type cytochrome [Candidatus Eremiobacteraeota bacterium]